MNKQNNKEKAKGNGATRLKNRQNTNKREKKKLTGL